MVLRFNETRENIPMDQNPAKLDKDLSLRFKTILILRAALLTGLVVLLFIFQMQANGPVPIQPISVVIGFAYFLFLIYILLLKFCSKFVWTATVLVSGDLAIVAGILYSTGGIESPFSFLNILTIIATGIILPRTACYLAASAAGIIYGLLLDFQFYGILNPIYLSPNSIGSYERGYVFYIIFINIISYYSVAFLSSILAQRLKIIKEELEDKSANLQKLQAFHQNILQNMGNGICTTDMEGRITSVNPAAEQIIGFPSIEILNKYCFEILKLSDLNNFFKTKDEPLPFQLEGECSRKDKLNIRIRMKISGLKDENGELAGFICVFEDLTALRAMENKIAQSQRLIEVGKISAGLAHEIRNPLASLSGSIQVLRNGLSLEQTDKRLMDIVIRETDRLNSIVSDFLNYANPRPPKITFVNLTQVLEDVVTLLKNDQAYNQSVNVVLNCPLEKSYLKGDSQLIRQLIWNLCVNALQAMSDGGELKISLKETLDFYREDYHSKRAGIYLAVEDDGYGIEPGLENKIFDPFFSTKEKGVGLGLAVVYKIVNQYDGYIGCKSRTPHGACFEIYIPNALTPKEVLV